MPDPHLPIENHGVIGNLQTIALVGLNGSIDFFCCPHFDSPSVFAALLDSERGGQFELRATLQNQKTKQLYLTSSNVLLTRYLSSDGVAEVVDFMPISIESDSNRPNHKIVRRAKCVRGDVRFHLRCQPRFDYARCRHQVKQLSDTEAVFLPDNDSIRALRLRSQKPFRIVDGDAEAEFVLKSGESALVTLEGDQGESVGLDPRREADSFKATLDFWRSWISRSNYRGRWREMVDRSALLLKLLTSQCHGSIIAAPTFGLPEQIGGGRNWDYRYTWIRDASFTLYGLSRLGFESEAGAFMRWLEDRCRDLEPGAPLQIMYGIDGRKDLTEEILPHFSGYMGSTPVRVGNGAADQLQLDIYGELLDSIYLYDKYGQPVSYDLWQDVSRLLNWVAENWDQPDEGIWEVRGGSQDFFYSRLMCWVALDRGLRLSEKRSFPAPRDKWYAVRDTIYRQMHTEFWNSKLNAFVQTKGGDWLDAACLLAPLVRFISPRDPRWLSTLRQIEANLVDDSLVYRYRSPDGLVGTEGTFCMCSFWYVENLARGGDILQARFLFEKMLGYANHVGLYAEELGPSGEHLGNFPQAFTHLALISAAFELHRRLEQHAG
jgi:GH15 family glucan-1,4-alpha-glucosidase